MKDDLYQLIDGELPDDASAELLHLLSVDPEKRSAFRQQMRLQNALQHNDGFGALTASEHADILGRLGAATGVRPEITTGGRGIGSLGTLLIGLVVGTGIGYFGSVATRPDAPATQSAGESRYQQPVTQTPPPVPAVAFNRDSTVAAIRDSLAQAMAPKAVPSKPKSVVRGGKSSGVTNDLTGAPEVRKRGKRPRR